MKSIQMAMDCIIFIGLLLMNTGIYADFNYRNYEETENFLRDKADTSHTWDNIQFTNCFDSWMVERNSDSSQAIEGGPMNNLDCSEGSCESLKDVNFVGGTLLHVAAASGRADLVKNLLDRGVPVDSRAMDNDPGVSHYRDRLQTALHCGAAAGSVQVLEVLVDHGANISAVTDCGDTALHEAALHGQTSAVDWLVERGADLEARNLFGATPLAMAMVNHREEVVKLLLKNGARVYPQEGDFKLLFDIPEGDGRLWKNPLNSDLMVLMEVIALFIVRRWFI